MEGLVISIMIILSFLFFCIFPIFLSWKIFKVLKKRSVKLSLNVMISLIPMISFSIYNYTTFYPSNAYYEEQFQITTGINLPTNAVFLHQYSGTPTYLEDHDIMVIKLEPKQFETLKDSLIKFDFEVKTDLNYIDFINSKEVDINVISEIMNHKKITDVYYKSTMYPVFYKGIAFLDDHQTIIVKRLFYF